MSITGHSLSFRERQLALSSSSEQSSHSKISLHDIAPDIDLFHNASSSEHSTQFPLKQSVLKRSLPNLTRLQFTQTSPAGSQTVQHNFGANADLLGCGATSSQDMPPVAPRSRDTIKIPVKPNEPLRLNTVNGIEHKPTGGKKRGIVVVHQRAFFRDCFVRCLEISYKSHDIFAFASISAWRDAAERDRLTPAVIVFFVDGSGSSTDSDLQYLESAAAGTPVVIMSDIDDVNYVMRALKGGARGYIPTSLPFNVAVEAVRLVEAGGTFVPVSSLSLDRNKLETASKTNELLTQRQMMVVEALCQGMANKQIAYELSMSEHTVKVHLRHIMRKLHARNRTEVAVLTKDFF